MKPEWFSFDTGELTTIVNLASRVLAVHAARPLAGVTFSGGEPFEQAAPLAELAKRLKESAGLDSLVYSGYRLDDLRKQPRFAALLNQADWIIDGEYNANLSGPLPWRGSVNQSVYRRGDAGFTAVETPTTATREVQVSLTTAGLRLTGFPDARLERRLRHRLYQRGIRMTEHES
jgi:anaerobic ribonucleoside-triphosphate reductase activating protein